MTQPAPDAPIRVLVVDDSALVRSLLTTMINAQQDMEAIGAASDPLQAREMIRNMNPDVLTLDIEMPRMDGLDFLEKLMRLRPMPVVMVSTLTARGAEVTMRALELGAVDFVTKFEAAYGKGSRNQFAGHSYDAKIVLEKVLPVALKKAKPGTAEFRAALRDAVEGMGRTIFSHGVMNWTAQDHWGYTNETGVLLKVVNGQFVVEK